MNKPILQINLEQAKRLKELGCHLHQSRQTQQISIETVASKTLIPVRLLTAIEAGNLEQLPEPVYIQGFIRRYADAIGIDGLELARGFPTQTDLKVSKPSWRGTVQAQLRPLHLYLLYMVLVIGAISGLSYLLNRSSTPQMVGLVDTAQKPVQSNKNGTLNQPTGPIAPAQSDASPSPSRLLPSPSPLNGAPKTVRVGLTLTSQSWIRVVTDGKTEFEGVLPEGTQRAWAANKQLTLRAGNAGGVLVSLNEGGSKRLGEPGEVEEVTFGANTQATNLPSLSPDASASTLTASSIKAF